MSRKQQTKLTRHGHPLPRVRSGSTYVMRGAALMLALTVFGLPINIALGGNGNDGVTAVLVVGEMMSLIVLVIAALLHRAAKKAIPRILTDEQTVHWTYSQRDWQRYTAQAWQRDIRGTLKVTGFFWGIALALVLLFFALSQGAFDIVAGLALGTGVALVLGLLLFLRAFVGWQLRRRRTTSDAYIGRGGFILNGWYYAVNWTAGGIRKITYKEGDPGMLRFDVGSGRGARVLELPVPQGHEAEAEHVGWRVM